MSLEARLRKLRENPAACHFDRVRILGRLRAVEGGGLTSLERALVDVAETLERVRLTLHNAEDHPDAYATCRYGACPETRRPLVRLEGLLGEEN